MTIARFMPDDAALARAREAMIVQIHIYRCACRYEYEPQDQRCLTLRAALRAYGERAAQLINARRKDHHKLCVCDLCQLSEEISAGEQAT